MCCDLPTGWDGRALPRAAPDQTSLEPACLGQRAERGAAVAASMGDAVAVRLVHEYLATT
jgi:hypothetical protein